MVTSALTDRSRPPRDADVAATLGRAAAPWRELIAGVETACAPIARQWAFSGAASGWSLRLVRGRRVLVYMLPREGHFLASFALGEKAVAAAREAGLPAAVMGVVDSAPRYAEGRGVRFEVRTAALARNVTKLVAIKHAH